ncbi:MAG: N-acetyltransferase, partial [Cyanobacteria bacterium J06573_2]
LKQQDWLAPEANAFICYGTTTKIKEARIIKHVDRLSAKLPEDYTIFPWHTLTEAEIKSIKNQLETDEYAKKLTPFTEEKRIENLNSLGLRYKDKVVGWMINHRTAPDTIRYTQMYVNPDSQPLSRSILFLAKAIDIQCKTTPEVPNATFRVETHNTPMVNFVNRRLAPHLEDIRYAWEVSKTIT